jgi:tetratricopeptide (TPR) repeat protein
MTFGAELLGGATMTRNDSGYQLHFHRSVQRRVTDPDRVVQLFQSRLAQVPFLQQLPPDTNYFTARQTEISDVMARLKQTLITGRASTLVFVISGRPGIGKSALATHLAHQIKGNFSDAQVYINLRGGESQPLNSANVLASFLRSWGVDEQIPDGMADRSTLFRSFLASRRTVLLLDNASDEAQVSPLIPVGCPCVVFITSRKRLTGLEDATIIDLAELSEIEALELLQKLATVQVSQAEPEVGIRAVNLCSRLPLSLCILGRMLKQHPYLSLRDCVAQLAEERTRLKQLHLSHPEVRASFNLSYEKFKPVAARLLRLLGLLADATFSPTVAAVLLDCNLDNARKAIAPLVTLGLAEPLGGERYSLVHDLVRLLAKGQLATEESTEARQAVRLRLSRWYLETVELMNLGLDAAPRSQLALAAGKSSKQSIAAVEQRLFLGALNWFETERLNLLAAAEWAYQTEAWELTLLLVESLVSFLDICAYWADWEQLHLFALEAARKLGDRQKEAQILNNLSNAYMRQANWEKARERYKQSLDIFRDLKDINREGQTLLNLGILSILQNQPETALSVWSTALTKFPPDAPEQKKLRKWMQSPEKLPLERPSSSLGNRQNSRGIFQAIGGAIKKLMQEYPET